MNVMFCKCLFVVKCGPLLGVFQVSSIFKYQVPVSSPSVWITIHLDHWENDVNSVGCFSAAVRRSVFIIICFISTFLQYFFKNTFY